MHAPRYTNPVFPRAFADPCVVRVDDGYLAVGTGSVVGGRVFEVLRSPDLVRWASVGGALEPLDPAAGTHYRAPELLRVDGRWWLYYCVGHGDVGHRLRVAVADGPAGPYRDCGADLAPDEPFAIDPHPFLDADGRLYLFYARDVLTGGRVGTSLAVVPLRTPTEPAGAAVPVLAPSADRQVARSRLVPPLGGARYDWHTLEGPFVVRREGRYHLFYSGGRREEPSHGVACAVADHPLGPWTERTPGLPVLRTVPGHVVGPGHTTVVTTSEGLDVIAYHAWDPALTARRLCVDLVRWTPDGPTVDGPTWWETSLGR